MHLAIRKLLVENARIPENGFKIIVFPRVDLRDFIPPNVKHICRGASTDENACELYL